MGSFSLTHWLIAGVFFYIVFQAFRGVFGGRGKVSADGSMVCPACGTRGEPKTTTRGSLWLEIVLWIFFIVPGVIYSIWRLTTRRPACPACGTDGMIPVTSPKGRELVA